MVPEIGAEPRLHLFTCLSERGHYDYTLAARCFLFTIMNVSSRSAVGFTLRFVESLVIAGELSVIYPVSTGLINVPISVAIRNFIAQLG